MSIFAFGRYALSIGATATLLNTSVVPASSATASTAERARIARAVANYIRDNGPGIFGTKNVELGPVATERPWAIADWRTVDRNAKGHVVFRYLCDSWNVSSIVVGTFNTQKLAAHGVPPGKAARLLADLSQSQSEIAYTKIGQPGLGCSATEATR